MKTGNATELSNLQGKLRVLRGWTIELSESTEYTGQSTSNTYARTAIIYPWGEGEQPEDYILHELLHLAIREVGAAKARSPGDGREVEELLVQDLCLILGGGEGRKCTWTTTAR